jgi:3-oxoadipate enol-lactonase/4-carboxymuconolactone decarboxylase
VDERRRWKRGMSVRRAVLGDDHVDRAARERGTAAFQDLITRYAWGEIWRRRGLPATALAENDVGLPFEDAP